MEEPAATPHPASPVADELVIELSDKPDDPHDALRAMTLETMASSHTHKELKEIASKLGLSDRGKKMELCARIKEAVES